MPILPPPAGVYDTYHTDINGTAIPIHLYYINDALLKPPFNTEGYGLGPFTQAGQTIQFMHTPFLDEKDLVLHKMEFDLDYYGPLNTEGKQQSKVNVFKIKALYGYDDAHGLPRPSTFNYVDKELETGLPVYRPRVINSLKHWTNESKLQQYPYTVLQIQDFNSDPLTLKPHLFSKDQRKFNSYNIKVRTGININGGYIIYVPLYKGDKFGLNEGMVCEKGLDLPVSSSSFNQYLATSKAQMFRNIAGSKTHAMIDVTTSSVDAGLGIGTLTGGAWKQAMTTKAKIGSGKYDDPTQGRGPGWTYANRDKVWASDMINNPHINYGAHNLNSALNVSAHGWANYYNAELNANAMLQDMYHAPRNINMSSTDALFSFNKSDKTVQLSRFTITEYYKQKLCDFWTLYGYKQNKLMDLSGGKLTKRKFFTYVKAVNMNLSGNNIEKEELDAMKEIFNNGITFWYYPRLQEAGIEMYNYDYDNTEV